jgi:broad specificity phosphatase PhoE
MELYLLRHGETTWNKENVFRGWKDIPLSKKGKAEAERCAEWFSANLKLDYIFTSPLLRAVELAELIAEKQNKEFIKDEHLLDFTFGNWEGKKKEEVPKIDPANWQIWQNTPFSFIPPSESKTKSKSLGEKIEQVFQYIQKLAFLYPEQKVLLISHRVILKGLFLRFFGLSDKYFWSVDIDTTGLSYWKFERDKFALQFHNCKYW